MYNAPSWTLGRSMISQPLGPGQPSQGYSFVPQTTNGWSNYNALIAVVRLRNFHGFTGTSNFGRAVTPGPSATRNAEGFLLLPNSRSRSDQPERGAGELREGKKPR